MGGVKLLLGLTAKDIDGIMFKFEDLKKFKRIFITNVATK